MKQCIFWLARDALAHQRSSPLPRRRPSVACDRRRPAILSSPTLAAPCRRDSHQSSQKELRQAVKLLYLAAGIQHLSMEKRAPAVPTAATAAATKRDRRQQQQQQQDQKHQHLTADAVKLVLREGAVPHQGALKELVYVFRDGETVDSHTWHV